MKMSFAVTEKGRNDMAECKDCIHDNVCNRDVGHGYSVCPHYINTADVVPTTELIELLRSLKRELHEKATYPPMVGVNSFVPLKLFDAVLQTYMNKYMEGNYEANRK
jgi:hypothetical protein